MTTMISKKWWMPVCHWRGALRSPMEKILQGCKIFPLNISRLLTHLTRVTHPSTMDFSPIHHYTVHFKTFQYSSILIQYKMSLIPQQINKQEVLLDAFFLQTLELIMNFPLLCQACFAILKESWIGHRFELSLNCNLNGLGWTCLCLSRSQVALKCKCAAPKSFHCQCYRDT